MTSIDDLIATAQPRTQEVRICARGDLVAAHEKAVAEFQQALKGDDTLAGSDDTKAAGDRVEEIEAELEAAAVTLTVSSVSRRRWADLLAKHPPSKEQRRAGQMFDPEGFSVAMVAECVDGLDLAKAEQLADALPAGEWSKLENAAYALNVSETPRPKLAAAIGLLRANERSSTTSDPEGSPEAGSLADSGEQ